MKSEEGNCIVDVSRRVFVPSGCVVGGTNEAKRAVPRARDLRVVLPLCMLKATESVLIRYHRVERVVYTTTEVPVGFECFGGLEINSEIVSSIRILVVTVICLWTRR